MQIKPHIFSSHSCKPRAILLKMIPQSAHEEDIEPQILLQEKTCKFDDALDELQMVPVPLSSLERTQKNKSEQDQPAEAKPCNNDAEATTKESLSKSSGADKNGRLLMEENGRERLKRHRVEVAGRVWIPDIWGQEELLKDWIDCSVFDASLMSNSIMSARAALVEEGRRANSSRLRVENSC